MILGWSEGFHDAAVAVINDNGRIEFASHDERFSRVKHSKHISPQLRNYVETNYDIRKYSFYERMLSKKIRQLYAGQYKTFFSPRKLAWKPDVSFPHHMSHAAATFQTSPFRESAAIVIDSIGEWDCSSVWKCWYDVDGNAKYKIVYRETYPNSKGLLYSALTDFVGLKPLDEEYIFMGMSAFGRSTEEGIEYLEKLSKRNLHRGVPPEFAEELRYCDYVDIAANAQKIIEKHLRGMLDIALAYSDNIVYGGGVALNCVANRILDYYAPSHFIMPNPGDAGAALGAACLAYGKQVTWSSPYLGRDIESSKNRYELSRDIVKHLLEHKICGVAHGRSEFGPRALGNRSLLADPRCPEIKDRVNEIKQRQKFRPFAPAILSEFAPIYFDPIDERNFIDSDYMQKTFTMNEIFQGCYPSVLHVDNTCRVQRVKPHCDSILRDVLEIWLAETGSPLLLNTSLNIRGEPMVDTVGHARDFERKYNVKVFT